MILINNKFFLSFNFFSFVKLSFRFFLSNELNCTYFWISSDSVRKNCRTNSMSIDLIGYRMISNEVANHIIIIISTDAIISNFNKISAVSCVESWTGSKANAGRPRATKGIFWLDFEATIEWWLLNEKRSLSWWPC